MNDLFGLAIQLAIVSVAIWIFLRFARRTRGNRSVRSLLVTLLVVAVGLYFLVESLDLEELRHLIQSVAGFVVVILAIVFQPELRRAISELGENQLGGGSDRRVADAVLGEIAESARRMAARKHGALIAIECDSPLDPYTASGQSTGAPVSRLLLESIFHPGGALHDGAVIVREGEIVASMCVLPLSESRSLDPSAGTRHRAALGLSEETDAVVLVVSEESGKISIARRGKLDRDVPPAELEAALRRVLGSSAADLGSAGRSLWRRVRDGAGSIRREGRSELTWIALAVAMGAGLLFVANQNLRQDKEYTLDLFQRLPGDPLAPRAGQIFVRLPSADSQLVAPPKNVALRITGTRSQHDRLPNRLAGVVSLPADAANPIAIDVGDVSWQGDMLGIGIRWAAGAGPQLTVQSIVRRTVPLTPDSIVLDTSKVLAGLHVPEDSLVFSPEQVELRGPEAALDALFAEDSEPLFEPFEVPEKSNGDEGRLLTLASTWTDRGLTLAPGSKPTFAYAVEAIVRPVGTVEREIALVCLDPSQSELLERYALPPDYQKATFKVDAVGLLPTSDPSSADARQRTAAILEFVRENLTVYVDVSEVDASEGGRSVPVRHSMRRDWRKATSELGLDYTTFRDSQSLGITLVDDELLLLTEVPRPPDAPEDSDP